MVDGSTLQEDTFLRGETTGGNPFPFVGVRLHIFAALWSGKQVHPIYSIASGKVW